MTFLIAREGTSKFFQQPLDAKKLTANQSAGVSIVSALSGMSHSSKEVLFLVVGH